MTDVANNLSAKFNDLWKKIDSEISHVDFRREEDITKMSYSDLLLYVKKDNVTQFLEKMKNNKVLDFNYLRCLTAIDLQGDGIEIVYQLYSLKHKYNVTIKTTLQNDDLTIDTITNIWRAANWHEREVSEMFGVTFNNHPDPRNLLMPEDINDSFPLRKSHPLAEIEILQGEGIDPSIVDGENK
ncbi:MAG: NADH-quinone oxidoreductase subunit C [Chloroflexi bacterium]|jgi:NADH-quinone oxidoreductase subunit C|nr:MAG: NADH-quinone oxidoreductase subunit C [Chloroflexota bacterium]|tara:strand:+ start:4314 stop:4865 length:552 start_codon:yes stop_codon:yes gene_type:complete